MTQYWQIAEAKAKWSELLEESAKDPQWIRRRDEVVGVVVSPQLYEQFASSRAPGEKSIGDFLDEWRALQREERIDVDL